MTEKFDFERAWLAKFSTCVDEAAGEEARQQVMAGSERLSAQSSSDEVITWTQGAMERLGTLVDEATANQVMTGCACQYSKQGLQAARQAYEETGDLAAVHRMLQAQFEAFLRDSLELKEEYVEKVVSRGWGLAGILEGNRVLATKIPKSGYLAAYMEETDPEGKRQYYCHCPRVREILKTRESLPVTYCYCGAGFYKGIWEEILQEPVQVEVLESILDGDEVCSIAVYLPVGTQ
jgi:predicted ArsR family transcriptional regulator